MNNNKISIVVAGANGQLGNSFKLIENAYPSIQCTFLSKSELDITSDIVSIEKKISQYQPEYCINCAAYTNVDQAEDNVDAAMKINSKSALKLAKACSNLNTKLIHFSTDYVYRSSTDKYFSEEDPIGPIGVYAASKLEGESNILNHDQDHVVIRTSWLYGPIGHNFVKTMIRLSKSGNPIRVVNDQFGSPTSSIDLANAVLKICEECENDQNLKDRWNGIFNFSNQGVTNWYEFARTIFELLNIEFELHETTTELFNAKAMRPKWSAMSSQKIQSTFGLEINHWRTSLANCLYEWPTYFNI